MCTNDEYNMINVLHYLYLGIPFLCQHNLIAILERINLKLSAGWNIFILIIEDKGLKY